MANAFPRTGHIIPLPSGVYVFAVLPAIEINNASHRGGDAMSTPDDPAATAAWC